MYGDEYLKRNLADPPRHISFAAAVRLLVGGFFGIFGWFFFGFGMLFFWIFALNCDPAAIVVFRGALETAPGVVTSSDETHFSEGGSDTSEGTPIYAHHYQFTHAGQRYHGVSYRLGAQAEVNEEVTVEFPANRPERSRIRGMRSAVYQSWVLFVVLFPLIGLIIILAQLRHGLRNLHLLKYGELAQGKLVSQVATNTRINDQTVYKLGFQFETTLGHKSEIVVKTHRTSVLQDDALETLLYDPSRPTFGTTIDHLPGSPRLQPDGSISVPRPGLTPVYLILPLVTIVGHGTYVLIRFVL